MVDRRLDVYWGYDSPVLHDPPTSGGVIYLPTLVVCICTPLQVSGLRIYWSLFADVLVPNLRFRLDELRHEFLAFCQI